MASWREQLAFAPLETLERGEEIGRRLRHAIELGVLEDGAQLPSESDLAARMCVSTLTLRTALAELRHLGLLETRRGKGGGSFVRANIGDIAKAQLEALAAYSLARIETAGTPSEMTRADSRFHIELAATSGSGLFTRQEMAMQAEVGALVWIDNSGQRCTAGKAHTLIVDAIRSGDAIRARALAEDHVRRDMNGLIDLRMSMEPPPPESRPGNDDIDRLIAAVELFAVNLEGNVAASIKTVEEAVQADLDRAKNGKLDELTNVYEAARRNLAGAMPAVYGMGFAADPSFFGEMGFLWCYITSDPESPQRMDLDLKFYDYSTAPWWPGNDADDEAHASYAYVDAFGANEYVVTFSKRIMKKGRMAGVAAVDILVRGLQAAFDPFLRSLPSNTCIVDQNEVVIATNAASLVGGMLSQSHQIEQRITLPSVPWNLCIGVSTETRD